MATPERVLIDTSALYAIRSATDLFHDRASAAFERLKDTNPELWATSYTLVETVALLHRRLGFEVVSEFSEWREELPSRAFMDSCAGYGGQWHTPSTSARQNGNGRSYPATNDGSYHNSQDSQ